MDWLWIEPSSNQTSRLKKNDLPENWSRLFSALFRFMLTDEIKRIGVFRQHRASRHPLAAGFNALGNLSIDNERFVVIIASISMRRVWNFTGPYRPVPDVTEDHESWRHHQRTQGLKERSSKYSLGNRKTRVKYDVTRNLKLMRRRYPALFNSCQRAILLRRVRAVTPSSAAASDLLPRKRLMRDRIIIRSISSRGMVRNSGGKLPS